MPPWPWRRRTPRALRSAPVWRFPALRIAPVTAHSIASINQLAPGRVFLGIGTGHTAMRVMGMQPMKIRDFREYLRVVRALLSGGEVEYTYGETTRTIRFLHQDLRFVNLENPVPIYVAANGPRALRTAGEYGDGLVSVFNDRAEVVSHHLGLVKEGAERAGRPFSDDFFVAAFTSAVVLKPGETLTSDRVIDECGSYVTAIIHFVWEIYQQTKDESVVPEAYKGIWDEYCASVEKMETPREKRYLQIHNGHCTFSRARGTSLCHPRDDQGHLPGGRARRNHSRTPGVGKSRAPGSHPAAGYGPGAERVQGFRPAGD